MMLTSEQIRAARALTRIDQVELANVAGVSVETIKRLEGSTWEISMLSTTERAIRFAFDTLGVEFIDESEKGYGVRFKQPGRPSGPVAQSTPNT
jgi:transcriptional regulator with XRE-family HTH domain